MNYSRELQDFKSRGPHELLDLKPSSSISHAKYDIVKKITIFLVELHSDPQYYCTLDHCDTRKHINEIGGSISSIVFNFIDENKQRILNPCYAHL